MISRAFKVKRIDTTKVNDQYKPFSIPLIGVASPYGIWMINKKRLYRILIFRDQQYMTQLHLLCNNNLKYWCIQKY